MNPSSINSTMNTKLQVVAITGASGFIGRHLVNTLLQSRSFEVRALSRNVNASFNNDSYLKEIQGDLRDISTIDNLLTPGCIVINLAYGRNQTDEDNILLTKNLINLCQQTQIKRLIHCSTAAVCGHNLKSFIDEETPCKPTNDYGKTKLFIEELLFEGAHGHYEYINLRPTSVFGPGGLALNKLYDDLKSKKMIINYFKSCLLGKRKMNLVSLDLVVEAILFFTTTHHFIKGETYFISQDDQSPNSFATIEKLMMEKVIDKKYPIRPIHFPTWCLSIILFIIRRGYVNPLTIFSTKKLMSLKLPYTKTLNESFNEFIEYKKSQ
jgi:nucleoside-diphosphate-sugar epimerase